MLTEAQKAAYLQNSGACPYCGSEDIEGTGDRDYGKNEHYDRIVCISCGRWWNNVYTLSGIEEVA